MKKHNNHLQRSAVSKRLLIAISLTLGFAIIEAMGGYFAHSLALLGEAGHMASDALALGISAFALWITLRPPSIKHSYGFGRAEVLAAWISSMMMFVISIILIVGAVQRLQQPTNTHIHSLTVIVISTLGILLNLWLAKILSCDKEKSLNLRAALLHLFNDIIGTGAALLSGVITLFTGSYIADPILSIIISILIAFSSIQLLRESMGILMESVPAHININQVSETICSLEEVYAVHDIHIWTLSSGVIALSAHINIKNPVTWDDALIRLKSILKQEYQIDHITLQPEVEIAQCQPCYKP